MLGMDCAGMNTQKKMFVLAKESFDKDAPDFLLAE
jgi:hypothetical protein